MCGAGKGRKGENPYGKLREMTPNWVVFLAVLKEKARSLSKSILSNEHIQKFIAIILVVMNGGERGTSLANKLEYLYTSALSSLLIWGRVSKDQLAVIRKIINERINAHRC